MVLEIRRIGISLSNGLLAFIITVNRDNNQPVAHDFTRL